MKDLPVKCECKKDSETLIDTGDGFRENNPAKIKNLTNKEILSQL